MKNIIKTIGISLAISTALAGVYSVLAVNQIHSQVGFTESGSIFSDPIYWGVFTSQVFWLFTASVMASLVAVKTATTSNKGN